MNKIIIRVFLSTALTVAAITSAAAQFAVVDNMGQPILSKPYTDVQGSAYLYDNWMKGSVTNGKNVTYEGVYLKYDQVADELTFKSESGEAKIFTQPITEFTINVGTDDAVLATRVFRKGFVPVDGASPNTFYEVLADGQTQLLKRTSKSIFEELPYGSSTKVKKFQAELHYYLSKDAKLTKIRNDKKALLKALSNKETELETYIKNNKLDLKKDADLAKVVDYYNSIN